LLGMLQEYPVPRCLVASGFTGWFRKLLTWTWNDSAAPEGWLLCATPIIRTNSKTCSFPKAFEFLSLCSDVKSAILKWPWINAQESHCYEDDHSFASYFDVHQGTRVLTIFDPSPHNLEFDVYKCIYIYSYIHKDVFWLSSAGVVLSICWSVMLGLPDMFKTFGIAAASAIMVCVPGPKRIQIVNLPEEICPALDVFSTTCKWTKCMNRNWPLILELD
jgi:hypothetical protein